MKKKIISILIVLSFIMVIMQANVMSNQDTVISLSIIDDNLMSILEEADQNELFAVDIWFDEVNSSLVEAFSAL